MRKRIRTLLLTMGAIAAGMLLSCTSNGYDTGDGSLSYLKSELVEVHTCAARTIDHAVNDEDVRLNLGRTLTADWAPEGDAYYRALLHYQLRGDETAGNPLTVDPVSVSRVSLLLPKEAADVTDTATDPLDLESAWVSKNNKYLNLRLALKSGQQDDAAAQQTVGLMHTATETDSEGHQVVRLTLLHNQNGVPQYYTVTTFASIPFEGYAEGTKIVIDINTYKGVIQKTFTR